MSTSEVHAAIQALYGQNAEQQKAANAFLVQFASTPAAWETALALLGVADPAVQYFGANMLYGKCKSDWATLPEAHRAQFCEAVGTHLSQLANAPGSSLAARRLCLVMAAAATRAVPARAFELVDRALALAAAPSSAAPAGVTLALEMQAAIAEETNDAASAAERQALVDALVPRLTDVLGTAERVFERCSVSPSGGAGDSNAGSAATFESLRAAALHAALAWLRLGERGGGGIVLSPGQLASSRGGLLRGALACLGADDAATADAATEFCVAALAYGAPPSPVPGEDDSAVVGVAAALVASGQAAVGPDAEDREDLARNVCKVATAMAERDATFIASASAPEACLALTSLVLSLAETHARAVMEHSADYFLMLNTVSLTERHPALHAPLFQRVLAACARHAAFPAGFVSWREAGEDGDAFHRFREQTLVDLLDNCFGMCGVGAAGGGYLGFVASQLDGAVSWQQAESALFLARAASSAAKRRTTRTRAADRERETPAETREREATDAFLRHTLTRIGDAQGANPAPASAVFASHPLVVAAAARVVGAYAPWLGQTAGRGDGAAVARACAAYLVAALGAAPEAFRHASGAFHALCAQCADAFARNRDTVGGLLDAAERALPESPPAGDGDGPAGGGAFGGGGVDGDDDRAGVVEGLARVVAAVADPREAAVYAKRLTAPIMARAARHAARAKATGEIPSALAAELKLLASALRFLEFPGFDAAARRAAASGNASTSEIEHPALAALSEAWPTLAEFNAEPWRSVPAVADATSAVYQKALLCAKARGAAVAPHVLEALAATFAAHHHPSCLDAFATAAEACFSNTANENRAEFEKLHALFCPAFASCVEAAAACLSAHPIADKADVARALFECAHKVATFAPFVFLNATHGNTSQNSTPGPLACHTALSIAVAALSTRERDAVRAATALLSIAAAPGDVASRSETWRAGRKRSVDAFFSSASGESAVKACLLAGADHAPRHVLRPLAQFLCALRNTYGSAVDAWLANTLADASFPDAAAPASPAAREAFRATATRSAPGADGSLTGHGAPLDARRWAAACVDFFLVCRRELGEDALVAHQM